MIHKVKSKSSFSNAVFLIYYVNHVAVANLLRVLNSFTWRLKLFLRINKQRVKFHSLVVSYFISFHEYKHFGYSKNL